MSARDIDLVLAADEARARAEWAEAALLFTEAADAEERAGGTIGATELGLRRDAHICLGRTTQFQAHRERERKHDPKQDFSSEWRQPTGELVRRLLSVQSAVKSAWLRELDGDPS